MTAEVSINLHKVDGDPRKMIAVRHLVKKYPEAIEYWHKSDIDERVDVAGNKYGAKKHKHGVLGHQFGDALAVEAIGEILKEKGVLSEDQVEEDVRAILLHDADKPTDMQFILMAKGGKEGDESVSWEKVERIVNKTDLKNKKHVLGELRRDYEKYIDSSVDVGTRVHIARAGIAGRVHKERLLQAGFSDKITDLQAATEYTGWNEIDGLLDNYDTLSPTERAFVIQKCVMNYVDTSMRESEMVDLEHRTNAVFEKGINVDLNTAYASFNDKAETAKTKQIRVGRRTEAFLADLVGVEPDQLLGAVEARMQVNIDAV